MNQVLFVIIVLVILYMLKDKWLKYMPDIVKKNLLAFGLALGFALCYFMENNIIEGYAGELAAGIWDEHGSALITLAVLGIVIAAGGAASSSSSSR